MQYTYHSQGVPQLVKLAMLQTTVAVSCGLKSVINQSALQNLPDISDEGLIPSFLMFQITTLCYLPLSKSIIHTPTATVCIM